MKFSFSSWQLVAVLAILMTAIVCAHVFAPGAVSMVTSMATTLFGALFIERAAAAPADPPAPALKVIQGGKTDGPGPSADGSGGAA